MGFDRRRFLKIALTATSGVVANSTVLAKKKEDQKESDKEAQVGCLVDTTLCIGCRQCEQACNIQNQLPRPDVPFKDKSVFRQLRRPTIEAKTVVNEFPGYPSVDQSQKPNTYAKTQCMHCLDPACVSACIVGAITRTEDGSVVYNPTICIGCRYCLYACPFQIPAYEYDVPLDPKVIKCEFCVDREKGEGANPACAAACPTEAIVFGKREALLVMARDRLKKRPDRYVDHIYGEKEVGGTSWLYLTGRPKEEIGLLDLPEKAPPRLTENIQHTIFKYGFFPLALYGALGGVMWFNNRKERQAKKEESNG